ncbi:hypothetical protein ABZ614_01330 [Streptomyces sp. NPDC013178]|uniref:hypothetical protein n=1 Tax=unclassified Streptomyces TaxID=2593676 RepID=UPI0033C6E247
MSEQERRVVVVRVARRHPFLRPAAAGPQPAMRWRATARLPADSTAATRSEFRAHRHAVTAHAAEARVPQHGAPST